MYWPLPRRWQRSSHVNSTLSQRYADLLNFCLRAQSPFDFIVDVFVYHVNITVRCQRVGFATTRWQRTLAIVAHRRLSTVAVTLMTATRNPQTKIRGVRHPWHIHHVICSNFQGIVWWKNRLPTPSVAPQDVVPPPVPWAYNQHLFSGRQRLVNKLLACLCNELAFLAATRWYQRLV